MKYAQTEFAEIWARAAARKGGEGALVSLLENADNTSNLGSTSNDRVLSMMAKCIFRAGFNWSVVEKKWPGFEDAFLCFVPERLVFQPDEFWEQLASDKRIVRHGAKIRAVRDNASFVLDISAEHGNFATPQFGIGSPLLR